MGQEDSIGPIRRIVYGPILWPDTMGYGPILWGRRIPHPRFKHYLLNNAPLRPFLTVEQESNESKAESREQRAAGDIWQGQAVWGTKENTTPTEKTLLPHRVSRVSSGDGAEHDIVVSWSARNVRFLSACFVFLLSSFPAGLGGAAMVRSFFAIAVVVLLRYAL